MALRRAYRGMLHKTENGKKTYYSHGIKDATTLENQDYVFTNLSTSATEDYHCWTGSAPMTRTDANDYGLFSGVPTDFVCLNDDLDGDKSPDYLDDFDRVTYSVDTSCPYDPTDPPVSNYSVGGTIGIISDVELDLSNFTVVTSDGPGNCQVSEFTYSGYGYNALYACTVFDWGSGWTGYIQVQPNSSKVYCPADTANYSALKGDQTRNFGCSSSQVIVVEGSITSTHKNAYVTSIAITETDTLLTGSCSVEDTSYRCSLPYDGASTNFTLTVSGAGIICGSSSGVYSFNNASSELGPYSHPIVVANNAKGCTL